MQKYVVAKVETNLVLFLTLMSPKMTDLLELDIKKNRCILNMADEAYAILNVIRNVSNLSRALNYATINWYHSLSIIGTLITRVTS